MHEFYCVLSSHLVGGSSVRFLYLVLAIIQFLIVYTIPYNKYGIIGSILEGESDFLAIFGVNSSIQIKNSLLF